MKILITLLIIVFLLTVNELWWRNTNRHGEISRKFIHISVGTFVAFWPFYLSWIEIRALSLAFIIVVLVSLRLKIFKAIHSVPRTTIGEVTFAVAVGFTAVITQNKYIYLAAILHMSLADGIAAIIGHKYGGSTKYKVLANTKSVAGTMAFLVVSLTILVVYALVAPGDHWSIKLFLIAPVAAILENVSAYGLDNLTVPAVVALMLRF